MRKKIKKRRIMSRIVVLFLMLALILSGVVPVVAAEELPETSQVELSFDPQGGTGTMDSIFCSPMTSVTLPENGFMAPEAKIFKKWEIEGQEYAPGTEVTIIVNTVAKAVWEDVEEHDDPNEPSDTILGDKTSEDHKTEVSHMPDKPGAELKAVREDIEEHDDPNEPSDTILGDKTSEDHKTEVSHMPDKPGAELKAVREDVEEHDDPNEPSDTILGDKTSGDHKTEVSHMPDKPGAELKAVREDIEAVTGEDDVASVAERGYETLQEALEAAEEGDTVMLHVDRAESVTITKSLTLDLSGHTLKPSTSGRDSLTIMITNDSFPTIQNGTIVGGKTTYISSAGAILAEDAAGFNLTDLTISGCSGPGFAISFSAWNDSAPDMNITNLTVSNNKTNVIYGNAKSNMTFTNCHFEGNLPEGEDRLITLGGRGNKTFTNCTFLNNKAQGIADVDAEFKGCRFEGNECQDQSTVKGDAIILTDTVVKNNTCTNPYGVAGVDAKSLTLNNSAVYNNKNVADGRNDLGEDCQNIDVTQMNDPTDSDMDFSGYTVDDKGTVLMKVQTFEAQINGTKYEKLFDAVEAAQDGDTIKLINTNEAGDIDKVIAADIWITKKLTIDLNGRDITSAGADWIFTLYGEDGKLSLINSADKSATLHGGICNYGTEEFLHIGEKIHLADWIYHNQNTIIDGTHEKLYLYSDKNLNGGKTMPVTFGDRFQYTGEEASLIMKLAEPAENLNASDIEVQDIVIAHKAKADLTDKVGLLAVTNPMVKVVFKPDSDSAETGDLVVQKELFSAVYLNGESGDDAKDGSTQATAVKTFAKAKELAEALAENKDKVVVYVTGTVGVNAAETWEFSSSGKITMYREPAFSGNLVKVGSSGNLTLKNIVIDGNKHNANAGKNSLILVYGGKLTMLSGAVLQNNKLTDLEAYPPSAGGAVYARENATVTLKGGTIQGNTAVWGGGIFALNAVIHVEDGLITRNHAIKANEDEAAGAGIATWYQSEINISGGTISHNISQGNGGGISLGCPRVMNDGSYSKLKMTGGSFIENTAEDSGGGLFVQGGIGEGYARAKVEAGIFRKNTAHNGAFGGGGIYVNGGHNLPGFRSGELYLTNALITGNTAGFHGGGYAACPTSNTEISVRNGAAFFENQAPSAEEIHIDGSTVWHGSVANPSYDICDSMLGGAPYHWMYDDGTEVPLNKLHGTLSVGSVLNLNNRVTAEAANAAQELAKVIISENHAGVRGGGIGSNGDVYIGTSELIELKVNKTWKDQDDAAGKRPTLIKIGLYRTVEGSDEDPVYIGYIPVEEDAEGNWSTTFKSLPKFNKDGKLFVYTVKEIFDDQAPIAYLSESTGHVSGDNGTIEMVNAYETTEVSGTKTWSDHNDQDCKRPERITIRLLKNGTEIAFKEVTKADGWAWRFTDLAKYENGELITYTITEDAVEGYSSEVSGYNVTNSYTPGKTSVQVTKAWKDNNNQDGKRPDAITIKLLADGEDTGKTLVLTATNNWTDTFTDLDEYKAGQKLVYTVEEVAVGNGYTSAVTGNAETGFTVTNSYTPPTEPTEPTPPTEPTEPTTPTEPTKPTTPTEPTKPTTPTEPTKPTGPTVLPKTGEDSGPYLWLSLMCMSVGALLLLFRRKTKIQND